MSTHTPGPWRDTGGEIVGNSRIVATACWCSGMSQEDVANRRLIEAAPDLLAALKTVIQWREGGERPIKIPRMIERVRAAIAKAEGTQS